MWAAQHTPSPRASAKNLDLRALSIKSDATEEPATYPNPTEMWLGKHQRSLPSTSDHYQYSVPSLSPRSSIASHHDHDNMSSRASEASGFSAAHSPERNGTDRVHIHVHSTERFDHALIDGVEVEETELKSPFVNGLDDEPGPGINDSLVSFRAQEYNNMDRRRNAGGIPDSPPLTARPGGALQPDNQAPQIQQGGGSGSPIGPLSTHLHTLLSQLTLLESSAPTVMASEYTALQQRLTAIELENATLLSKREALFSLRDEDVSNLIKVRVLLAQERREHEALRKLRNDDLQNVIELRNKLAQATWANQTRSASSSVSSATISHRRMEKTQSISSSTNNQSHDLWQAAKTAALEQRVLELESANADLRQRLDNNKKAHEVGMEMQIVRSSVAGVASGGFAQHQVTTLHELEADNLRLKQRVEKMKYQLETSQAIIECFSEMLKSH